MSLGSVLTLRVGEGGKIFTQCSRNSSLHSKRHSSRRRASRKRSSLPVPEIPAFTPPTQRAYAGPNQRPPRMKLIPRAATVDNDSPRVHFPLPAPMRKPLIPLASEEPGLSDSLSNVRASASKFDLKNWAHLRGALLPCSSHPIRHSASQLTRSPPLGLTQEYSIPFTCLSS